MPLLRPALHAPGWAWGLLLAVLLWLPQLAAAQSLESALSPGPLTKSHAKLEGECAECHVRFDRAGQDGRCLACHKDVAQDIRARKRLHGRQAQQACRSCHVDHRGRDMNIAAFDTRAFDHTRTEYALRGRHASVACTACHTAGRKYREAPGDCLGCHRKDDKHKGSLGTDCASCHQEQAWKDTRIDHAKTRFPLLGKHVGARCESCHKSTVFSEAPTACVACHRKEDRHKARFGERCDTCHSAKAWTAVSFRHDTDTRFPLRARHKEASCTSCHTGWLYRDKLSGACVDCHRKDDKHKGSLGTDCSSCHGERSWKEQVRFDHAKSRFPLLGRHAAAECKACHQTPQFKDAPSECVGCHLKDDRHQATLGSDCAACHTERDWKASRFDHGKTRFTLAGGHASPPLACTACHVNARAFRPTARDCISCHRKDDRHAGQLGTACENCHVDRGWKITRFDHNRARFALTGAHAAVACASCHKSNRYREAPRDCAGCHAKDDRHQGALGARCDTCHSQRDWRLWTFDHARQAGYPLEAAHAGARCEACHRKPAPPGRAAAELDRSCVACHRADDLHDGAFGARCDQCHSVTKWKDVSNRARVSRAPGALPNPHPAAGRPS